MAEEKPCPFCILHASEENRIIFESEDYVVIPSNPRLMKGHILVIPWEHHGALYDFSQTMQRKLIDVALVYQKKVIEVFSSLLDGQAGCDVSWHTRPFMPLTERTVPGHFHIHVRPRFFGDPYYQVVQIHETDFFQRLSPEEIQEEADWLRGLLVV